MKFDTAHIYGDLHRKLVTAEIKPSEKLKSEALREVYGCSANTIRDVLFRLNAKGLVSFEEQRGFRACEASPERRTDITRFRILLEREGARLSIERGTLVWESQLSAAHHKLSHIESHLAQSGEIDESMDIWSAAEFEFHDTLISACGSAILREAYANTYNQFRQQMVSAERDFGGNYFEAIVREHKAILDAALARDTARCEQAIYDHLKRNFAVPEPIPA